MIIKASGYILTLDSGKTVELTSAEHDELKAYFVPYPFGQAITPSLNPMEQLHTFGPDAIKGFAGEAAPAPVEPEVPPTPEPQEPAA